MATLEFYLRSKTGDACDFVDVGDFSSALAEALRRVHRSENATGRLPRYEIIDVRTGSLKGVIAAVGLGAVAITNLVSAIGAIRDRRDLPIRLTGDDIRALRQLTGPLDSQTAEIVVGNVPVDHAFRDACDLILLNAPHSLGQAIGRLEGMNTHNRFFFRLYPSGSDRGAECFFPEDMYEKVLAHMRKRVRVEGTIHRDPDGIGIDRITDVTLLERVPEDSELPTMRSLLGMFRDNPIDLHRGWENQR